MALLASTVLASCAASADGVAPTAPTTSLGTVTVFAASSLTDVFTTIGHDFSAAHPGTTVNVTFAGSSALATQIASGAPADVIATASSSTMEHAVRSGVARDATPFATNALTIAVPRANPGGINALADLQRPGVSVALCQPQVPCGAIATHVLAQEDLHLTPVTLDPDARAVLTKVRLGEVDAGIVYVTDAQAAGDAVATIAVPPGPSSSTVYPIATVAESTNHDGAQAFVDYVVSPAGQNTLREAGFGPPP